jgi:hypothetical protein
LEVDLMAFSQTNSKGVIYHLHSREARGGAKLYFFSKDPKDSIDLPPQFQVVENPRTGLLMIKKK